VSRIGTLIKPILFIDCHRHVDNVRTTLVAMDVACRCSRIQTSRTTVMWNHVLNSFCVLISSFIENPYVLISVVRWRLSLRDGWRMQTAILLEVGTSTQTLHWVNMVWYNENEPVLLLCCKMVMFRLDTGLCPRAEFRPAAQLPCQISLGAVSVFWFPASYATSVSWWL
jgi:hypothetical protein